MYEHDLTEIQIVFLYTPASLTYLRFYFFPLLIHHMKIVALANQKGGVGKTTSSVSLAAALAESGQRVLLVDLDPQANATSNLGFEPDGEASLYHPLLGEGNVKDKVVATNITNLSLIPSDMDLAGVEIELARSDDHLTRLRKILQSVKPDLEFEYIILDTPPSLGVLMTSALAAADEIIIPLQCEWFGLEGLAKIVHVIDQIKQSGAAPDLHLEGILMTMYDGRTNLSKQVLQEVTNYFPYQVYESVIPRTIKLGEAPSHGLTILQHDPNGIGARSYRAFAQEFLTRRAVSGPIIAQ